MDQEELALNDLIYKDEKIYFVFAIIVSIIGYLFLLISIVGLVMLLYFAVLSLFLHGLMLAQIRINGVRLSAQQFLNF